MRAFLVVELTEMEFISFLVDYTAGFLSERRGNDPGISFLADCWGGEVNSCWSWEPKAWYLRLLVELSCESRNTSYLSSYFPSAMSSASFFLYS